MGASEKNNTADTGMVIKIELLTSLFKSPFCATQEREELVGCIDSFAKSQHPISCPPPAPPIPLPTLTRYYNNDSTLRNLHSSHRITNKMTLAALWKKQKKKKKKTTCSNVRNSSKGIEYTKGVPLLSIQTSGLGVYGGKNLLVFFTPSHP